MVAVLALLVIAATARAEVAAVAHHGDAVVDGADDTQRLVADSLALCAAADALPVEQRVAVLARGLALAESAVALDDRSARAHFAIVCSLGKATSLGGVGLGTWRAVHRLRREIDATLALAPDDPDALAAKGALLIKLPRWLGGDPDEARRWLRRALVVDPMNATARAYLDDARDTASFVAPAVDTVAR